MGMLKTSTARVNEAATAVRDSFSSQATLNTTLALGIGVALAIAVIALIRSGHRG